MYQVRILRSSVRCKQKWLRKIWNKKRNRVLNVQNRWIRSARDRICFRLIIVEQNKMENLSIPTLRVLYKHYVNWVSTHPERTTDLEASVKWISYFLAGISPVIEMMTLRHSLVILTCLQVESTIRRCCPSSYIPCPTSWCCSTIRSYWTRPRAQQWQTAKRRRSCLAVRTSSDFSLWWITSKCS